MPKIDTLTQLKVYCQTLDQPIFGIGINAFNRLGIRDFYPRYRIVCLNQSSDLPYIQNEGEVFCLNKLRRGEKKNALSLLRDQRTCHYINRFTKPYILCYKVTKRIEAFCQKQGWRLIGQATILENKIFFRRLLKQANIPSVPGEIADLKDLKWSKLSAKYGRFVIQLPRSGGGKGTFFIFSRPDFLQVVDELLGQYGNTEVIISKFIQGYCPSITGCVTKQGIFSTNPQLQVLDIPEVRELVGSGMFCGHDWSSSCFNSCVHRQSYNYIKKIGEQLRECNYRGIFGLDLIVEQSSQRVYVLECNPRLLGSMPSLTMVQLQNQEIPIIALHILEFLGLSNVLDFKRVNQMMKRPKRGAQLFITNKFGRPVRNMGNLPAGVYFFNKERLIFRRHGYQMNDLKNDQEFLITDGVPFKEHIFNKRNGRIMRLLTWHRLLDKRSYQLNSWANTMVREIYYALKLKPGGPVFKKQ